MEKKSFRKWFENYWYHYKYTTLGVAFLLFFVIVSTVQLLSKKNPDANLLYIGPASINFSYGAKMNESIDSILKEDYNKDGKKNIDYIELTVIDEKSSSDLYTSREIDRASRERFQAELLAGDSMIYLVSEEYYGVALESGVLMPLREVLNNVPEYARDEYSVYLADTDLHYMPGFEKFPVDTILCVRYPVSLSQNKKKVKSREENNLNTFRDFIRFVCENKPEEITVEYKEKTVEEFLQILGEEKENATLLTDSDFFEKAHFQLFKSDGKSYILYLDKIYSIGKSMNGSGLLFYDLCDFDGNGIYDLIFSYEYNENGESESSVSVYNMSKMKETFLNINSKEKLSISKIDDSDFMIFSCTVAEADYKNGVVTEYENIKEIKEILSDGDGIIMKSR